jgi:hypothetical protein
MLKIAIIGTGNISHNHIQGYLQFADRIYPEKAEEKKRHYGLTDAKVYASHQDILNDSDIDVFDVCTPPYVHAEISVDALNAGKHVLCEKPMAASLQECDAMIRAAQESGKTLSIIAQNRTALETKSAPLIDGVQGKRSLELIAAIYKSAITRSIVTLPLVQTDPFYQTGGLVSLAPHFYEKSASVENFANEEAIPLGKNMDTGA